MRSICTPEQESVVHCAKFYSLQSADGPVRPLTDHGQGANPAYRRWTCGPQWCWRPGFRQKPIALESGLAQLLPASSGLAVTIHYRGAGEAVDDASVAGLYFAKTAPQKQLQEIAITKPEALIPVAAEPYPIKASFTTQNDIEAIAIRPRVHPLVISLQATARRPDGSEEVLIWTRRYQFDWEPTYHFRQPIALPKGTRIEVIAYFDNSEGNQKNPNDPPKSVHWSELSSEPLCALLVANSIASPGPATIR